jgi:FADH2 O2-dependent halogenase
LWRKQLTRKYDLAVFGSGFAGSLIAMIAKRQGHSVVLLERGKHPRVVIGESSTPLANLLLEELANRYDLPAIRPLSKWGSWQRTHPQIACGLKRGFTFYHHELGVDDVHDPEHLRQLLVAASPHNEIADTHWYRADFDALLVKEAEAIGVDYLDEVQLGNFVESETEVSFTGTRAGETSIYQAMFAIDATGPRGFLHRALQIGETSLPDYPATQTLYSHFSGVGRPESAPLHIAHDETPYPPEDAAVHHVFDGGWIWVLRFNNGITSAGVAATEEAAARLHLSAGEQAWHSLLDLIPGLKKQFATARALQPFTYLPRLSFMSSRVAGRRWAMLPSSAGFVDPLLSTGFPLTLLGVSRLAEILESNWNSEQFQLGLQSYADQTTSELLATARLIGALYANMNNFAVFKSLSLLYFAAASYSETVRRLNKPHLAQSFLLHDHPIFGPASKALIDRAMRITSDEESACLSEDILRAIEPFDVAGLSDGGRRSWYPVEAEDLFRSAAKVQSTHGEIEALLQRCGFYRSQ